MHTTINKKYLFVIECAYVLGKTVIMEPSDIKELFMYNHIVRQSYIDEFQKNIPWQEMVRNHDIAWLSLKDTLLHIIWVEDNGLITPFKV